MKLMKNMLNYDKNSYQIQNYHLIKLHKFLKKNKNNNLNSYSLKKNIKQNYQSKKKCYLSKKKYYLIKKKEIII